MKNIKLFTSLAMIVSMVAASSVFAFAAGSAPKKERSTEQQIERKLRMLPYYGVFDHITFQLQGDTVILSGKVNSLSTRRDAESAVKDVKGIATVVNEIQNLPPSPFDDQIRRAAFRAFAERGLSQYLWEPNPEIRIIVENGRLSIEGYVTRDGDRDLANVLANGIPGVFKVTNNLNVGKPLYR